MSLIQFTLERWSLGEVVKKHSFMYCERVHSSLKSSRNSASMLVFYAYWHWFFLFYFSEFGGKIFTLKPVVKVLPKLFDHSDKNVREEVIIKNYELWLRCLVSKPGLYRVSKKNGTYINNYVCAKVSIQFIFIVVR